MSDTQSSTAASRLDDHPRCPRCGYILSGVTTWRDCCPLQGRCSECGLEFCWRDVLNPRFNIPGWCIEYGLLKHAPIRLLKTVRMMFVPARFWRELQMHHDPQWLRLPLLLVVIGISSYMAFAISSGIATWFWANRSAAIAARATPGWLHGIHAAITPWADVTPTIRGPMPSTLRQNFEWNRITIDGWHNVRFAVDVVYSGDSRSVIPQRSFEWLCTLLACPLSFLLLPISRRLAKVRWRHIFRIGAYSLIFSISVIAVDYYDQLQGVKRNWTAEVANGMIMLSGLATAVWWAAAAKHYLRMPHAWLIGLYVVGFAYLLQRFCWQAIDMAIEVLR